MILSFPSFLLAFTVCREIPGGQQQTVGHLVGSSLLTLTAPIHLKLEDQILVDPTSFRVELVMRAGIVIWRAVCVN